MPRIIVTTKQFEKDYKRARKHPHWKLEELQAVVRALAEGASLDKRHRDHKLGGEYDDHRECHIRPDWLLIYQVNDDELYLVRTGSHSELFG